MSLDPPRNWSHAEQMERGEDLPLTVERQEGQRIGRLLSKWMDPRGDHSARWWTDLGCKVLANHRSISQVFRDYEGNPHRIGPKDPIVLRQQQTARLSDADWWLEEAGYHKQAYDAAVSMLDRITAAQLPEHDVDAREQDRQDDRDREQRQAEAAREQAPRFAS